MVVTLPSTAAGLKYTFVLQNAALSAGTGLSLSPAAADAIHGNGLTSVDDKDLILAGAGDAEGDSVTLVADGVDGKVITLVTDPDGGGAAPTDNYDVTVTDSDSIDVLVGAGANRDTANTELVGEASLGAVAGSTLTLNVSNAGNAKAGLVILYIR